MTVLLHPTYFPSIATFAVIAQRKVVWEVFDNFQKQTYRNRCYICTDQGKHMINIPIKHVGVNQGRQLYSNVILENQEAWQKQHWRTLETAYRTSPYFEFYEDDINPIYQNSVQSLFELNLETISIIMSCLGIEEEFGTTMKYESNPKGIIDGRHLVDAKKPFDFDQKRYTQVFHEKHGFVSNLSILDLLFNEGPNTVDFLMNQSLDFL